MWPTTRPYLARPLESLTGKYAVFRWVEEQQRAFEALRQALISAPVLALNDVNAQKMIFTDASDVAISAVLLQEEKSGWHPTAYLSRALNATERNWSAEERETLAVTHALHTWKVYLFKPFVLKTDNSVVSQLLNKPTTLLSKKEQRWVSFLQEFNMTIEHVAGPLNIADALSRREGHVVNVPAVPAEPVLNAVEVNEEGRVSFGRKDYMNDPQWKTVLTRLETLDADQDTLHRRFVWGLKRATVPHKR